MGNIFYLMGKSATGKDTIYKLLLQNSALHLKPIVLYTTRPIRKGETNGVEYYFTDYKHLEQLRAQNKIIEERTYYTTLGIWHYFTVNDQQFTDTSPLLMIGTLESFQKIQDYFGKERVIPLYIEVEDGLRLERALARERTQSIPNYEEMCRRFLADQKDFSEEKLKEADIKTHYENRELNTCINQICSTIKSYV
ncbi:MAG: guanylate kinase [Lachnospiraceae bacterium]|nr:guanylate kinase [Lachnospiraceae bacterium]